MTKDTFITVRPHQGDKWYGKGDRREAVREDVRHLLENDVLAEMPAGEAEGENAADAAAAKPAGKKKGK